MVCSVTMDGCRTSSVAGETAEKYSWWLLAVDRLRLIFTFWLLPSIGRKWQSTFFWSVERDLIKFVRYDILRSVTFISLGIITMSISLHKVRAENGKIPTLYEKIVRTYRYTLEIRVTAAWFVRRRVRWKLLSIIKDAESQKWNPYLRMFTIKLLSASSTVAKTDWSSCCCASSEWKRSHGCRSRLIVWLSHIWWTVCDRSE